MEQQIQLIYDLIAENPDATVRDFIDTLKDIEAVEEAERLRPTPMIKVQGRDNKGRWMTIMWVPA